MQAIIPDLIPTKTQSISGYIPTVNKKSYHKIMLSKFMISLVLNLFHILMCLVVFFYKFLSLLCTTVVIRVCQMRSCSMHLAYANHDILPLVAKKASTLQPRIWHTRITTLPSCKLFSHLSYTISCYYFLSFVLFVNSPLC